jgi:uncharacterized protein (TIGR04141 family)
MWGRLGPLGAFFGLSTGGSTSSSQGWSQIRSVDRLTLHSPALRSQIQAIRAVDITDFSLDLDRDLLRAVTGNPRDR